VRTNLPSGCVAYKSSCAADLAGLIVLNSRSCGGQRVLNQAQRLIHTRLPPNSQSLCRCHAAHLVTATCAHAPSSLPATAVAVHKGQWKCRVNSQGTVCRVGSETGSRPSSVRTGIRGDRVGMATKAALEPSQLETHITSLMRASFGRLKVPEGVPGHLPCAAMLSTSFVTCLCSTKC